MEKAVLDLSNCKYLLEMHERMKTALQLPPYYGRNWDALFDSLTYESPVDFVEIRGEDTVSGELQPSLEELHAILDAVRQRRAEAGWKFDYKIVD